MDRLRRWRVARGLSVRQVAALARVRPATWTAIETGTYRRLSLETCLRIVEVTGGAIAIGDLRGGGS